MLQHYVGKERKKERKKEKEPLVVVAIVLFFGQQSSVPAAGKVLLQTTIGLWVGVFWKELSVSFLQISGGKFLKVQHTLSTNKAQSNRQEDQGVQRRPDDERQPHAEVVDLEDLAASESQHEHAEELGDCD